MLATSSTTEPIRAETVRSGLVESTGELTGCIVDASGAPIVTYGDVDRPMFYRSAIKPFQAQISLRMGARLAPERLAVASSSHAGFPAHVAIAEAILSDAGLDETALQTPPDWPRSARAGRLFANLGHREPRRVFHNCSGKHAAWLAACVAAGHDTATYLEPEHPLQRQIIAYLREMTGVDTEPVGVDGCGAPTIRGTTLGLARAFARLSHDSELDEVRTACARYPALVSGSDLPDGKLAQWWPGPMKTGAEGLMACSGNGFGAAVKSHSGSAFLATAALGEMLAAFGLLSAAARDALADVLAPPVLGGGRRQGTIRIVLPR